MIYGSQKPRIVIATPMRDLHVSAPHYASAWSFMGSDLGIIDPQILVDDDLVRARSRAVRVFLEETRGAMLLQWDSDVEGRPDVLRGMVQLVEQDESLCVGAAYPKKRLDKWGECREFAHYTAGVDVPFTGTSATVQAVGLGFMLTSRRALERMVSAYDEQDHWYDGDARTVGIFGLLRHKDHKGIMRLWPEDYSFCHRAHQIGLGVRLYTGPGSPLAHVGMHVYRGKPEHVHPFQAPTEVPTRNDLPSVARDEFAELPEPALNTGSDRED